MSDSSKPQTAPASIEAIEAELAATRAHLASTVDELVTRTQPKELARRQAEDVRLRFIDATRTPEGDLRAERVSGVLAAVAVVLIGLGLLRRRRG